MVEQVPQNRFPENLETKYSVAMDVKHILEETGAIRFGHFVLNSGRHSDRYVNKDAVYPHTEQVRKIARNWAVDFMESDIDVVVGPQLGAIILANNTADELTKFTDKEVIAVPAEKEGVDEKGSDRFKFKRGYDKLIEGKRVLIVEDVVTTGGSVKKVVDLVRETGGEVVGVGIMVEREDVDSSEIGVEPTQMDVLLRYVLPTWDEKDCGQCKNGVPVNEDLGHGKEYGERNKTS